MPNFTRDALVRFGATLFRTAGVRTADADLLAGILVRADERGYAGHGMVRVTMYLDRIERGDIRLDGQPRVVHDGKATAVVDGDRYFGQVGGVLAVETAIAKAREHGVGVVGLIRSGHIGRLAEYVELAAEQNMVGIGLVSVGGSVTVYGGREPVGGTNPIAYAIPGRDGEHILLDFATSAMSQGTLQHHVATGAPIPPGVLLDGAGQPTTDYRAHVGPPRGAMLPFGGYKGSGMMVMADILGGVLIGGGPGHDRGERGQPGINTAIFQVIDVGEFQPAEEFRRQVGELADFIRSSQPAPGFDAVRLPGDRARQHAHRSAIDGVHLEDGTWSQLQRWAAKLGVSSLPEPVGPRSGTTD